MTIRQLAPGETIPEGVPARYQNRSGYVRLRWLVGPGAYLEAYEHRVVVGLPPADMDVHHLNRKRDDNRRENLLVLSRVQHALLHSAENAAAFAARRAARGGFRSVEAQAKAERARQRRDALTARALWMKVLYESGLTTTEVGAVVGLHPSRVSVHLRRVGTEMRTRPSTTWRSAA